jgi:hypothetical protein
MIIERDQFFRYRRMLMCLFKPPAAASIGLRSYRGPAPTRVASSALSKLIFAR